MLAMACVCLWWQLPGSPVPAGRASIILATTAAAPLAPTRHGYGPATCWRSSATPHRVSYSELDDVCMNTVNLPHVKHPPRVSPKALRCSIITVSSICNVGTIYSIIFNCTDIGHVTVMYRSCDCYVQVLWLMYRSCDCYVQVVWLLFTGRVTVIYRSCDCYVQVMWLLCTGHVTVMYRSCDSVTCYPC